MQKLDYTDLNLEDFQDRFHHVILRSHILQKKGDFYRIGESIGHYELNTGFTFKNPKQEHLKEWAQFIYDQRLPLIAGLKDSHTALLHMIGEVVPIDAEIQPFCRYEVQPFMLYRKGILPLKENLRIKRATKEDVNKLFNFYRGSEMEARSKESLRDTIQNARCFYIQKVGKIVSAALTHCETEDAGLIGGVYTPKAFRGKGYAKQVVSQLVNSLIKSKKNPSLFYAEGNTPAEKLYLKLGFEPAGEWMISELYYKTLAEIQAET